MALPRKARTVIVTCAVAAVTATGAWYGADLKASQEARKESRAKLHVTNDEILAQLEATRSGLIAKKTSLEKKIAELEEKRRSAGQASVPQNEGS
ncbi:MAG: hypothetical protein Q9219_005788 [cf. Caloplaca sp. 3 TL-2023]